MSTSLPAVPLAARASTEALPPRGRAVYDKLSEILADAASYPPGSRIGTATELRAQYGVTAHAMRTAVGALRAQGRLRVTTHGLFVPDGKKWSAPEEIARRIADTVRARIKAGKYEPGVSITSAIAAEFDVTVRKARTSLQPLIDERLLITRRGHGTSVP